MWAFLVLIGVILLVHWFEYRQFIEEYTFAQPKSLGEIRDVIREKTPIVVEIGVLPWREEIAATATWNVATAVGMGLSEENEDDAELYLPMSEWLRESPRPELKNKEALAIEMGLTTGLSEINESRPWWWMPGFYEQRVGIMTVGEKIGLTWIEAERRWIGCSGGNPIVLWLAHGRHRRYLPGTEKGADPWNLTSAESPWIGRVQYIEVRVRPGWCIAIPAHWGVAVRAEEGDAEGSWVWSADQHSVLSWGIANAMKE